jgi:integrase
VSKRGNGEGSTYQRKDGYWVAKVKDPRNGKWVTKYRRTQAAANKARLEMLEAIGNQQPAATSNMLFTDFLAYWVENHLTHSGLRKRSGGTQYNYKSQIRNHIAPALGKYRLDEITQVHVETFLNKKAETYSEESVRGYASTTSAIFRDACKLRLIRTNPCQDIARRRGLNAAKTPAVDTAKAQALLESLGNTTLGAAAAVLATSACRTGEALGMRWCDLDLESEQPTWVVRQTITRDHHGRERLGETTKTGRERTLSLTPRVCAMLRAQRARVAQMRLKVGDSWHDLDLVFPSSIGTIWSLKIFGRMMKSHFAAVGLTYGWKQFRTGGLTQLFAAGFALIEVMEVGGHSKASTTLDIYGRLLPKRNLAAIEHLTEVYALTDSPEQGQTA